MHVEYFCFYNRCLERVLHVVGACYSASMTAQFLAVIFFALRSSDTATFGAQPISLG